MNARAIISLGVLYVWPPEVDLSCTTDHVFMQGSATSDLEFVLLYSSFYQHNNNNINNITGRQNHIKGTPQQITNKQYFFLHIPKQVTSITQTSKQSFTVFKMIVPPSITISLYLFEVSTATGPQLHIHSAESEVSPVRLRPRLVACTYQSNTGECTSAEIFFLKNEQN